MKISASYLTTSALLVTLGTATLQPRSLAGQHALAMEKAQAEPSTTLTVTVRGVSRDLRPRDLAAMPQKRVTVHNVHSNRDESYTGVTLYTLLSASGLPFSSQSQGTFLKSYIRAQGTDFYFAIYSAAEVTPDLNSSNVLIATEMDGHDLGTEGLFKLIDTADKRPARWIRNLLSISLVTLN